MPFKDVGVLRQLAFTGPYLHNEARPKVVCPDDIHLHPVVVHVHHVFQLLYELCRGAFSPLSCPPAPMQRFSGSLDPILDKLPVELQ